ncbi:MAG TPA: FKBP-type peptidyl-prolyl cis-trans isomerase, partial [Chitinophagaceae bacterium]
VINTPGTGATANICSVITINYSGALTNGNTFNQTTSPVSFRLSDLITGWKNGIPLIKQGGNITLYVPPSLAYGDQERRDQDGNVIIPANSMLIFTIDLVAVQ